MKPQNWLPFEALVALRFLREGRIQTLFIVVGIAIGVAVIIFMSALLTGLQANFVNRVLTGQARQLRRSQALCTMTGSACRQAGELVAAMKYILAHCQQFGILDRTGIRLLFLEESPQRLHFRWRQILNL
jgi:hypothetical protein